MEPAQNHGAARMVEPLEGMLDGERPKKKAHPVRDGL